MGDDEDFQSREVLLISVVLSLVSVLLLLFVLYALFFVIR